MRPRRLCHPRHPRRRRRRLRHPYHFISTGTVRAFCAPSLPTFAATHRPPCFRVVPRVFRCRRIAWLSSCCRRLDVAAVLVMLKLSFQGTKSKSCCAAHCIWPRGCGDLASHRVDVLYIMHSITLVLTRYRARQRDFLDNFQS